MNDYDRDNLKFLLGASPETLEDWYDRMEKDDHIYAAELLAAYSEELRVRNALSYDVVTTVVDAENVLRKYRL